MPEASSASARGFITLVAGLRLKQSRSWISRERLASASIRAVTSAAGLGAQSLATSSTRVWECGGIQPRGASLVMLVS